MRRNNIVEFYQTKVTRTPPSVIRSESKFTFQPQKGNVWLQKILFWILKKLELNADQIEYVPDKIERILFDSDKFMQTLVQQRKELIDFYHYYEAERVLIGQNTFNELMESDYEFRQMFTFNVQYKYGGSYNGYNVYGMKMTIIPWMEGILVLPKTFDK